MVEKFKDNEHDDRRIGRGEEGMGCGLEALAKF